MNISAVFSSEQLVQALSTNRSIGKSVFCYDSVDSTNVVAHRFAKDGAPSGVVITSDFQTNGKGRGSKQWSAQKGENITASIILRPTMPLDKLTLIPILAAVSIAQTIETCAQEPAEIKWPNDVLIRGKKVSGVLLESNIASQKVEYVILGIGLNVNQTVFPPPLNETATSLLLASGQMQNLTWVFVSLMQALDANYALFENNDSQRLLSMWRAHCSIFGKHITFFQSNVAREGVALDIDERGFLKVTVDSKEERLSQAEITSVRY